MGGFRRYTADDIEKYIRYYFPTVSNPAKLADNLMELGKEYGVHVMSELVKAKVWLNGSGKTYKQYSRFLTNWIIRATASREDSQVMKKVNRFFEG